MQPILLELGEKHFVGLGTRFITILSPDGNNKSVIPDLWHRFVNRENEIAHRAAPGAFGLVEMLPASEKPGPGEMFYMACIEVTAIQNVPDAMISRTVPAGRYARFTHKGSLAGLRKTMAFIYGQWLPTSGLRRRPAPDLELYDHRFDPNSDTSEFDIFIPVM